MGSGTRPVQTKLFILIRNASKGGKPIKENHTTPIVSEISIKKSINEENFKFVHE